jgi:hypothetical protein
VFVLELAIDDNELRQAGEFFWGPRMHAGRGGKLEVTGRVGRTILVVVELTPVAGQWSE